MAKITAIIVTLIGILLILQELNVLSVVTDWNGWIIAIGVLVIGIAKLIRNFKK